MPSGKKKQFRAWRIHDIFSKKSNIPLLDISLEKSVYHYPLSPSQSPQKSSKYNQEKTGMNVHQTQTEKRTNIYSYSLYRMSVLVQHGRVVLENTIQVLTVSNGENSIISLFIWGQKKRGNCFLFISNFFVFKSRFFAIYI